METLQEYKECAVIEGRQRLEKRLAHTTFRATPGRTLGSALRTGIWSPWVWSIILVLPDYWLSTPVFKSISFQNNYRIHRKLYRWVGEKNTTVVSPVAPSCVITVWGVCVPETAVLSLQCSDRCGDQCDHHCSWDPEVFPKPNHRAPLLCSAFVMHWLLPVLHPATCLTQHTMEEMRFGPLL